METARTLLLMYFVLMLTVICVCTIKWGTKWFWALKLWVRLALMGSLLVTAGIGVAIQVKLAERTEPVWVDNAKVWPKVPLGVKWSWDLKTYQDQIRAAMKLWNRTVGCDVFVENQTEANVRVLFLDGTPCNTQTVTKTPEYTYYCHDGTADIDITRLDDIRIAYLMFAHGMGHVLGLDHDPTGLMSESITSDKIDPGAPQLEPNPKDLRALKARYCPQLPN